MVLCCEAQGVDCIGGRGAGSRLGPGCPLSAASPLGKVLRPQRPTFPAPSPFLLNTAHGSPAPTLLHSSPAPTLLTAALQPRTSQMHWGLLSPLAAP